MSPLPRARRVDVSQFFGLLSVLALAACRDAAPPESTASETAPPGRDRPTARHVVLVTIDTLRADHVGAYGGDVATPHLDRLAADGALAVHATAHVPLTRPSHLSLFSGLLPPETGVRDNVSPVAIPDVPLLAEVFGQAGFETAAFVSAAVVSAASGLDRGFDVYSDDFAGDPSDPRFLNSAQNPGDMTVGQALAWLEKRVAAGTPSPLFVWIHLYDPHEPYEPPEPYASRYPARPYAGEVAWSDDLVGRLVDALSRFGLADETLLAVTSDHGEGLGDHDELLHGFFVYESTLRVPLIVRGPGIAPGTRLENLVGLVDLYPTLLDLAGVDLPDGAEISGRSFAAALRGAPEAAAVPVYAESLVPRLRFGWSELRVVRDGPWKLIQAPRPELYDLAVDPGEQRNLLESQPTGEHRRKFRELRSVLDSVIARERSASDEPAAEIDPELRDKLRALGYLGGTEPASTTSPGADPKDKVEEFRLANALMRQGLSQLHDKSFEGSAESFRDLLGRGIESAEIHLYLGQSLLGRGRSSGEAQDFRQAAVHFIEATKRTSGLVEAWLGAAEARVQLGEAPGALETLRDAQALLPREARLRREEARLLRLMKKPGEARRALVAAIEIEPRDAFLHAGLSEVLRELGDLDGAVASLRRAVEIEPAGASYWTALGMMLGGTGELEEAERAFRTASKLDPSDHRAAYNLGLALVRLGRGGEARPFFERCLELEPRFQPARQQLRELGDR
ncbi:MAG: sulfatase-like hydrolase/transferase [Thermoanaerobaculia bacterium]